MKVLIIRFSSIGDIVLTTPVIRAVKTQLDDAEVHFCTKPKYANVIDSNPYIDKVHFLENGVFKLINQLRSENFDYIVDLHNNLRTRIIKTFINVDSGTFYKMNLEKWLMVNFKIDKLPRVHIVDRYMMAVEKLNIKTDSLGLDYFIKEKDDVPLEWLPETHQKEFVAVAIGGQHTTKKLPLNRLIELCDRISKPIILLGGPEDAETGKSIEEFFFTGNDDEELKEALEKINKRTLIFNGCGKFNLNQSASIIKKAKVVFTHDTGLMHIAAAFKKRIYSIWGNTIPNFGMYPYRTKFTIFENNNLSCRPCSKIGYNRCPKGHFNCMEKLKYDFFID